MLGTRNIYNSITFDLTVGHNMIPNAIGTYKMRLIMKGEIFLNHQDLRFISLKKDWLKVTCHEIISVFQDITFSKPTYRSINMESLGLL
jgi:hypothetical protein